jgi:SAM-dependent methyltransferase
MRNIDAKVVEGFGNEWQRFNQSDLSPEELGQLFATYFDIFPWEDLPEGATGFDLGCGSGRWAKLVAPRVGLLHCIDPSDVALRVAAANLSHLDNCQFHLASVDKIPLPDMSADFGYSLGVLHHVPDTGAAIAACTRKLKPGAPFLIYLYFAFDNKPVWYRMLWRISNGLRVIIARTPFGLRVLLCDVIALLIYWPLARTARLIEMIGAGTDSFPLSAYRTRSFYTMRTDALDRFGTRLEKRFTRAEIKAMLEAAGLSRIEFSDHRPYWCAVGRKS